jgi:ABC-type multidrug transport system fused ATPase/permease subunit
MLRRLYLMSPSRFEHSDRGHLHNTLVQDTERTDIMVNALAAEVLPAAVTFILLSGALLSLSPVLFLLLILLVGPLTIGTRVLAGGRVRRVVKSFHEGFENFSHGIYRVLELMELTLSHSAEAWEIHRQERSFREFARLAQDLVRASATYRSVQQMFVTLGGVMILVIGGAFLTEEAITTGDLISFFVAVVMVRNAVTIFFSRFVAISEGTASLGNIREFMAGRDTRPPGGIRVVSRSPAIELRGVSFGYSDRPVLVGAHLALEPRTTVALLGANGSGKTTLLRLVVGLDAPESGEILADGVPYDEVELEALRRSFGVVWQRPILASGTVWENVTYGSDRISEGEVEEAARIATADSFIRTLPESYRSRVGEGGAFLSGGQQQKLALTRALARSPGTLILDEPGNHLDVDTVRVVFGRIRARESRPTILLTTHIPEIAALADRVVRLQGGRVTEEGGDRAL